MDWGRSEYTLNGTLLCKCDVRGWYLHCAQLVYTWMRFILIFLSDNINIPLITSADTRYCFTPLFLWHWASKWQSLLGVQVESACYTWVYNMKCININKLIWNCYDPEHQSFKSLHPPTDIQHDNQLFFVCRISWLRRCASPTSKHSMTQACIASTLTQKSQSCQDLRRHFDFVHMTVLHPIIFLSWDS